MFILYYKKIKNDRFFVFQISKIYDNLGIIFFNQSENIFAGFVILLKKKKISCYLIICEFAVL